MTRPSSRVVLAAGMLLLGVVTPAKAQPLAAQEQEALTHSRQAAELHRSGDRNGAIEHYRRAAVLAPTALRLLNLASAYQDGSNMPAAMSQWRRLRQDFWNDLTEDQKQYVLAQMEAHAASVAELVIVAPVAGSNVDLDGVRLGQGPYRAVVLLRPGEHRIMITGQRQAPEQRFVTLAGNTTTHVEFAPAETLTTPRSPQTISPPAPRIHPGIWAGAAAAAASGVAAGVFWALASSSKSDFDERVKAYRAWEIDANDPGLQDARNDTKTYANWAVGFGITAGVLALGTATAYVLTQHRPAATTVTATPRGLMIRF